MNRAAVALTWAALLACGLASADDRRSGLDYMTPATQALQRDDGLNPAMLWVRSGEAAWSAPPAPAAKACEGCHDQASRSMRAVATRYPAFDTATGSVLTLAGRINACRERHQGVAALAPESDLLLSLEALVAMASRGLPITPPDDPRLAPLRAQGRALYAQRIGQLDLSCANCHDGLAGRRLGGSVIPQGHPTAYPIYRLEWQALGSLQRRLRNCIAGVRAEVPAYGSAELVALELELMRRAAGMAIESPGVRP